jgi:phospholipase C
MLAISPWARVNFVDHSLTNQASIITFIEDNWLHGKRLGKGSFDGISNSITGMFDFQSAPRLGKLFLNETTGTIRSAH